MERMLGPDDNHELIEAFSAETTEILGRLEELLLSLETAPDDDEVLHEIFRGAHTIKGNAACLQFEGLTAFGHVVEELLEQLREGRLHATTAIVSRLLDAVDAMRDLAASSVNGDVSLTPAQEILMRDLVAGAAPATQSAIVSETVHVRAGAAQTLRVGIEKLDRMLDLTGEIAIARGHVRQLVAQGDSQERISDALREVDRLSFDLQELVMSARLVPLAPALRPFQRVVRDVASTQQKVVALVMETGEVEVDTTVIEHLKDPITHMLRNAIDHGIEHPHQRVEAGKPAQGTIVISAAHEGRGIVIRISDDGRGLDEASIAERAKQRGADVERLSRADLLSLVFEPGFSTAAEITDMSGRGVGMDVVRRNVEALRGTISIDSIAGHGTTVTIRLPLTLTVIEGFGVAVADETYVIPIDAIIECTALPADASMESCGVLNVRGEVLPFLRLRSFFGLDAVQQQRENVVVVQHDNGRAGLVVDELLGSSETVMKPLGGMLRQTPGVAGSSILGNGRVALVLDTREVVRRASELNAIHQ
jgi:two-component system, chemotaxis family, sensor kinase CheA